MSGPVSDLELALIIAGLTLGTFVTRTSFLLAGARLKLSHRVEVALRYAPVCTLTAIIVPDILLHGPAAGFDLSVASPRLIGVAAAGLWLCFSRHIVGCLVTGMAAYAVARLLLPAGALP
jgi:branched-subunit amino acid transport protein